MGGGAATRARQSKATIELVEHRLATDFQDATPEALESAQKRARRLESLRAEVAGLAPKLQRLEAQTEEAERSAAEGRRWMSLLDHVALPPGVSALATEIELTTGAKNDQGQAVKVASDEVAAAEKAREALGERDAVVEALGHHRTRSSLRGRAAPARTDLEQSIEHEVAMSARRDELRAAHEAALAGQQAARDEHMAQHLAGQLQPGRPCLVCRQMVGEVPARAPTPDLDVAEATTTSAAGALRGAGAARG